MMAAVTTDRFVQACYELLQPQRFKDYCPNGLQVQGRDQISRIISGVTASQALIEAAIDLKADAIFVHHGLFWRGQSGAVTGWMKKRLAPLLKHDINLIAYHLPLDAHAELGNNAQLAQLWGLLGVSRFGDQDLGVLGVPADGVVSLSANVLIERVSRQLGRTPVQVGGDGRELKKIAWCSGGAQSYFEAAIDAGADVFLTGEMSEPQAHLARETGVLYLACGHHATERYGAQAVAGHLAKQFGLHHQFVDIDNPA
jgi:dinuclear metal center YbgI/SA1388 family protein